MHTRLVLLTSLLAACGSPGLKDPAFPTGSSTIVATARGAVVNVNEDEGTISRTSLQSGESLEVAVAGRPGRLARVGASEIWVTLRDQGAVQVVTEESDGTLVPGELIPAGVEPFGIVASEDGSRVYVASSRTGEIIELDGRRRTELRRFEVANEPRWIALHPSGEAVYVGSFLRGQVSHVNLETGAVSRVELPVTTRNVSRNGGRDVETVNLVPRVTGDLAVSPDGTEVAVPMMYVDVDTPVDSEPADPTIDPEGEELPGGGGYGSSGLGVSRMNPTIVAIDVGASDGAPTGDVDALFLGTSRFGSGMDFDVTVTEEGGDSFDVGVVRSYPASATYTADALLVTAEGSGALYAMRRAPFNDDVGMDFAFGDTGGRGGGQPFTPAEQAGFEAWPVLPVFTGEGPRGVAVVGNEAWIHSFIERSVAAVDVPRLETSVRQLQTQRFVEQSPEPRVPRVVSQGGGLDPQQEAGRRLFYSASDARMAGSGAGVSCATCHFDVRNDGLTWTIDGALRQTPSLAGPVTPTAPVTWANDVDSIATEAQHTTSLRMGGEGLTAEEAGAIQAFVETTPYPEARLQADDPMVVEGARVFEAAGCAECHSGEYFTDNLAHEVQSGKVVQTPTLRGIAASAPYLHDGTLPDLAAVVTYARSGAMGDTSALSDEEARALVAYLESL